MSKTKFTEFNIKRETDKPVGANGDIRVVKMSGATATPTVKPFEFGEIKASEGRTYASVKQKYGSLAITDDERATRAAKDARFMLNPLQRGPLSVEEEERRVIDERVRERVAALAEQARAKAQDVGYREGLKKGYQEAFQSFKTEGADRIAKLSSLIEDLEGAKSRIYVANERFLIELVYKMAKMVLLKELSVDKDYLLRLSRELIERVGVRDNIRIQLSQQDGESVSMLKEGLLQALGDLKNLNVQVSDTVKGGGCILETEWNAIDASVETQLEGLYSALVGRQASAEPSSDGAGDTA